MNNDTQITNAARNYVGGIVFSSPSDVLHFTAGAKWADGHPINVWHPASEEPQGDNWYILLYCDGMVVPYLKEFLKEEEYESFKDLVKELPLTSWAYISELLPKGGEK